MITLENGQLDFRFPEVHEHAELHIDLQRTLRIPDDNRSHYLPPGLGSFPLAHVDDHKDDVPRQWYERGGVFFPMYQAEAMWIHFHSRMMYPFAVKVAAGKIDAIDSNGDEVGIRDFKSGDVVDSAGSIIFD